MAIDDSDRVRKRLSKNGKTGARGTEGESLPINLRAAREQIDRRVIRQALTRTENNISSAAKLLGISRPTLYDLMKQYQLGA